MRRAAGRRLPRVPRALVAFVLLVTAGLSNSAPGSAQAQPDAPQRWDGLIERLSAPGQWYYPESFTNPRMSRHAVSGDGRYFVFMAEVPNPPNAPMWELFIRDRSTSDTRRSGPGPLNAPPVISSDGNHLAFELCDPIYRPDGLPICDVWTLDPQTFRLENMSTAADGTPSLADSREPVLSRNGRFLVFRTNSATLLPPSAAPGQLVLRDRDTDEDGILDEPGATSLRVVSVSSTGETGNLESGSAEVSADGRYVAFRSPASNLVADDTNGTWDVFQHDVETGETRRINVGWNGQEATPGIDSPAISMSEDGRYVAFAGDDHYLTNPTTASDDNNAALDVFVFDRSTGSLSRVDVGAGGTLGNGHTYWPSLSADGRYVAVTSIATNVSNPGTPGRAHVFVYDRVTSQATRVTVNPDGTEPDSDSIYPTISADGSLVTFVSQATNLPTAAPAGTDTVYAAVHFEVTPLTLTLPARGGEVTATVTAQRYVRWEGLVTDWTWLNWGSAGAYGVGNGTASFQAYRNSDPTPRTTTVVVRSKTLTVTQEAGLNVTAYSPAEGPATGGTVVTIDGSGFEPGMRVFFDGSEASSVEYVDTTRISATTPAHPAGDAWIYVATPDWAGAGTTQPFRFADATPPEMYPPGVSGTQTQDGWFTSDVHIVFGYWDPDSAIVAAEGCSPAPLTTDTPGTTFTCTVTSHGGTSSASVVVKRDATGPAIDVVSPAQTVYRVGTPAPAASYSCTDALNPTADCSGTVAPGTPVAMTPGHHDFQVMARDSLGNVSWRALTYAVAQGGCTARPEGLVAWFPFETIAGGTPQPTYAEPVGGSDGIPFNTEFVAGAVGSYAMAAAGSPAYVGTGSNDLFALRNAFTLAAWVKPGTSTGEFEVIAGREGEYLLGLAPDGTLHWSLSTATHAWGWTRTSTQLQRDLWAHVALVYDGSQVTVYLNGITREGWSTTGQIVDAAPELNEFRIGGREDLSAPSTFSGAIDDVLVANRAFTSSELQGIALAASDGLCGPRPTTVSVTPNPVIVRYGESLQQIFTVTLSSESGPVAGRTVLFFDPSGLLLAPAQTDSNGQIRFGGTVAGSSVGTAPGFAARFLGDFYYTLSSGANVVTVEPADPTITWPAPAPIPYGTPLGAAQLNATANVPGTFTYTPPAGTQLGIGSHTLTLRFDPADSTNYRSTTASTTLTVVDPTPPQIVPAIEGTLGSNGWYTSNVQIAFAVQDPESTVVSSTGCGTVIITTDTVGTTLTCSATSAGGTASSSVLVKRDTAAPTIQLHVPAATLYESTLPWRSRYSCADPLSGMDACTGPVANDAPLDLTPGYHTFEVAATDKAGNRSTKTVTYAVGIGSCAPRPAGFVAWWPFEEPYQGNGTMASYRDMFNGITDTGVNTQWRFGQGPVGPFAMSTAASPSAYMSAGTRAQLELTGTFTIAVWAWPTLTNELGVIAGREGEYLLARFPDGTLRYSLATTTPGWGWIDTGHVLESAWNHIALTYDGGFVRAYVNGREVHAAPATGPIGDVAPTLDEFRLGARQDPAGLSHFTGGIDDVQIYNRALDASEIERVFLAGTTGLCSPVNTYFTVQPNPVRVTYGATQAVEIVARLTTSSGGGLPLAGRPVTIFKGSTQITSGITDENGEVRGTTSVTGVIPGTSPTAFRVQHAGDFYYAAQTLFVPLITDKATPQITWPAPEAVPFGAALGTSQLNATANVAGTFAYTPGTGTALEVGTHTLSVTFTPASPQNYTTASATVPLEVTKATPTIALTVPSPTYDGQPHAVTGTVTGVGGAHLGAPSFTYNGAPDAPTAAGSYNVVATFAGDANHNAATATATLTIAKATATVTAIGGSYTYDGAPHPATGSVTGVGGTALEGSLTFTYNGASDVPVNAGTYAVVATFDGDANHTAASATATITIAKATATVTAIGGSYTYDGAPHPATGSVTGVGGTALQGPVTFTYNGAPDVPVNAGTYDVVASFAGDANHTAASATATIAIARAATVLQWAAPAAIVYGTPLSAAQLNATSNVAGTFSYAPAGGAVLGAGSHALGVTFTPADATNYTGTSASTALTVARAPLAVRANDAVKPFGAPLPILTASFAGFVNGESAGSLGGVLALATSATQLSPVGAYPIVPSGLSSPNYTIAFVNGALAVVRGAVVVNMATSPEPSGFEGPMTFTASVSAAAPSSGTPAGVVRFYDGSTLIGSAALAAGTASLSTAGLDPGTRTIEARYDGDSSFEPGMGASLHTVRDGSQTPTVTMSSSRNPSNAGQSVTFTATVSMPTGGVSGLVEFRAGDQLIGTGSISAGRATFTTSSFAAGSHAVTARYVGSGTVPPATSNVFVQAVAATGWKNRATSMTIAATPNPAALGSTVTVTATVSGSSGTPTGRILFIVDDVVVADVAVAPLSGSAARATLALPNFAHGRHSVSATYLGDPTYRGSTARVTATVN